MPGQPVDLPELAPEHVHRHSVEQADQGKQPCPVEPVQQKLGLAGGCFDGHEGTEDNPAGQAGKNAPPGAENKPRQENGDVHGMGVDVLDAPRCENKGINPEVQGGEKQDHERFVSEVPLKPAEKCGQGHNAGHLLLREAGQPETTQKFCQVSRLYYHGGCFGRRGQGGPFQGTLFQRERVQETRVPETRNEPGGVPGSSLPCSRAAGASFSAVRFFKKTAICPPVSSRPRPSAPWPGFPE